jgi:hypothetical protein
MSNRVVALVLPLVLGIGACGKEPVAPRGVAPDDALLQREKPRGTGFVLSSLTGTTLPLGLDLGDVTIQQAVLKDFGIVEDIAGNIVGLDAGVVLDLTGGVLGTNVVTEEFRTEIAVISSGRGCSIATVDPAPPKLAVDVLGRAVFIDVPAATVQAGGSGAVGNLLCAAGSLLTPVTRGASQAIRSLVDAINRLLI